MITAGLEIVLAVNYNGVMLVVIHVFYG